MGDKQTDFSHLSAAQQDLAFQRFRIIQPFLEGHIPLTRIVQEHPISLRTARRWVHHYREAGLVGLIRSTRSDRGTRRALSPQMEKFVLELLWREQQAPIAAVYRRILSKATEQGWPAPSYSRVYALARSLKTLQDMGRREVSPDNGPASLQSGEPLSAVKLIEQFIAIPRYKEVHDYQMLFRWLKQLPRSTLMQSPALCLSYASILFFAAPTDQIEPHTLIWMQELLLAAEVGFEATLNGPSLGETVALRALLSWRQGLFAQAANDARRALTLLPPDDVLWRGITEYILGSEALRTGQFRLARQAFQKTRALGQRLFTRSTTALAAWTWGKRLFTLNATIWLARTCFDQGELRLAAAYYHQVLSETREASPCLDRAHALLGTAWIAYEWNDLAGAQRQAQEAALLGEQLSDEACQACASLLQARLLQARGETESAHKVLVELQARRLHLLPHIEREILLEQARLSLALGELAATQIWATEHHQQLPEELPRAHYEQEHLLVARLYLAQNRVQEAIVQLQRLLHEMPEQEHSRNGLAAQALLALAEAANKQVPEARHHLQTVLSQAQREGFQRLFLDEGEGMVSLLHRLASHLQEKSLKTYLQQLFQGVEPADLEPFTPPLLDPLSPQELRVLRLLATGSSAPQIAQELIVSVTTVRTQIQSIYRKLGVNNRVAASAMAHTLHLL
jgi:LuxR family maltose regulon positive regulatory protein